jgi:hypothetical protein
VKNYKPQDLKMMNINEQTNKQTNKQTENLTPTSRKLERPVCPCVRETPQNWTANVISKIVELDNKSDFCDVIICFFLFFFYRFVQAFGMKQNKMGSNHLA